MLAQPQAVADLSKHLCNKPLVEYAAHRILVAASRQQGRIAALLGAQAIAAVRTGWCQQHGNTNSQFWPALPA